MQAYIINMDTAQERWNYVAAEFSKTGIPFERVSAVNGRLLQLPIHEFDEVLYRRRHGKHPNRSTIGCYLSHLKTLRLFLESPTSMPSYVKTTSGLLPISKPSCAIITIFGALGHFAAFRISQQPSKELCRPRRWLHLSHQYDAFGGSGAYMVHRKAAEVLLRQLVPMSLPLDHALDREWAYGLKSASIFPLPVDQVDHAFGSQIRENVGEKLPIWRRYWTVFPYRAINEVNRVLSRGRRLREAKAA